MDSRKLISRVTVMVCAAFLAFPTDYFHGTYAGGGYPEDKVPCTTRECHHNKHTCKPDKHLAKPKCPETKKHVKQT